MEDSAFKESGQAQDRKVNQEQRRKLSVGVCGLFQERSGRKLGPQGSCHGSRLPSGSRKTAKTLSVRFCGMLEKVGQRKWSKVGHQGSCRGSISPSGPRTMAEAISSLLRLARRSGLTGRSKTLASRQLPWLKIAKSIKDNCGGYQFASAACSKKWDNMTGGGLRPQVAMAQDRQVDQGSKTKAEATSSLLRHTRRSGITRLVAGPKLFRGRKRRQNHENLEQRKAALAEVTGKLD